MDREALKKIANSHLEWDHQTIDDDELDEVIKMYNYYLDLLIEAVGSSHDMYNDRYCFTKYVGIYADTYRSIFLNLVDIKKNNIAFLLDYLRLFSGIRAPIYNLTRVLQECTDSIAYCKHLVSDSSKTPNDIINRLYECNKSVVTLWLDDYAVEAISNSTFISESYKNIIKEYQRVLESWNNNKEFLKSYNLSFGELINISYYYFLYNNYFRTEPENVISFLEEMRTNPINFCDQIEITGFNEYNHLYDYLDYLYKNRETRKAIK